MPASTAFLSIASSSSALKSIWLIASRLMSSCSTLRGADDRRGHPGVAQRPRQRHLGQLLAAGLRDLVEGPDVPQHVLLQVRGLQRAAPGRAGVRRHAVEVAVGEQPLRQRGEDDAAHALGLELVEEVLLDPAVEHRVRRLVDQQRRAELTRDRRRPRAVFLAEYDEMPAYSALPERTAWSSAIIVSAIGVSGSKRWL